MNLHYALALAVAISLIGCSNESPTVVFIFPNRFSGLMLISEDKVNGLELRVNHGEYAVEIPQNGKLAVKNPDIFFQWHKETGRYKDGTFIPYEAPKSDTEIAFFGLPYVVAGRGHYWFVGTRKEFDPVPKKNDFEKLPLATKIDPSMLNAH